MPRSFSPLLLAVVLAGLPFSVSAQTATAPDGAELIGRVMQADTNGDGQVTRSELLAFRARQFSRLDRNGDGFIAMDDVPGMMAGRFEPRMKKLATQFDANHDGRVSHNELAGGPTPGFDMADANHDGVATGEEMRAALANAKSRRP